MVHENDPARGGCDFFFFFDGRTPDDLLQGGLYHDLALALYSGHFWPTSERTCPALSCRASARRDEEHDEEEEEKEEETAAGE